MPPPTTFDAAIVICAYTQDRWNDLIRSIESARSQQPSGGVVVVVDHNEALRARLAEAGLDVQVTASDGPPGLSGARNTGVAATTSDVVAFLDDDARASAGWLDALLRPYRDERVVAVGGRIRPAFDRARPRWLPAELDWIVGCTYAGMPDHRGDVRNVIGAGMSVRRSALAATGGFDHSVGRVRSLPLGGEETALCIRARRLIPGARVVYEPAAVVSHRVPASRANVAYALTRGWAEGITTARVARLEGHEAGLSSERTYAMRTLPAAVLRELGAALRGDPWGITRAAMIVAVLGVTAAGFGWETIRAALGSSRAPRPVMDADTRPLRILQVTPRYSPLVGGVETHTEEVARRLAARGHRVTVATTDPGLDLPRHDRHDGVEIVRVRAWPKGRDWYLAPGLLPVIGRRRWDVVHLQGVHTIVPPLGALASILGSRPFVLTLHSGGHSSRVRTAARPLQWRLIAPLLRRAAAIVAVSRFEADRFSEAFGVARDRVEVIRNGVDRAPRPAAEGQNSDRVLSLGRLERYKGHQRVVAAMPVIRRSRPEVRLHVAGTGAYEDALRRQVAELGLEDAVTIGPIPHEEMPDELARSGVVALLSEYEAHPIAVAEALAAGCRVVVADTSGLRELAEDGLVRSIPLDADPEVAATAILDELDRPVPASPPELPTWDDTVDALERLYRRVAGA